MLPKYNTSCLIKLYLSLVRSERDEYVRLLHMPGE